MWNKNVAKQVNEKKGFISEEMLIFFFNSKMSRFKFI